MRVTRKCNRSLFFLVSDFKTQLYNPRINNNNVEQLVEQIIRLFSIFWLVCWILAVYLQEIIYLKGIKKRAKFEIKFFFLKLNKFSKHIIYRFSYLDALSIFLFNQEEKSECSKFFCFKNYLELEKCEGWSTLKKLIEKNEKVSQTNNFFFFLNNERFFSFLCFKNKYSKRNSLSLLSSLLRLRSKLIIYFMLYKGTYPKISF